jgi:hypothetical protein
MFQSGILRNQRMPRCRAAGFHDATGSENYNRECDDRSCSVGFPADLCGAEESAATESSVTGTCNLH